MWLFPPRRRGWFQGVAAACEGLGESRWEEGTTPGHTHPPRPQTQRTGAPGMCRSGSCGRSTSTGCRKSGSPSRSCRERTCVPCPRSSSASAHPPAATSCTPTSTSGSLVGAREREGAGEGGRCCAAGDAPLIPRSSLPAAWMKEKAAPGDVRYCGEFCMGSAPLVPLVLQAGPEDLRGPSLCNCNYPEHWSSCCCGICVVTLPLPRAAPRLSARSCQGEMARTPHWPCPTPPAPLRAAQGQD